MFDENWARAKLNMTRRTLELQDHIRFGIPEVKTMDPGLIVDIGCGPGDFLAMCRTFGHDILGIDAENGEGGMGDAYLDLCRQYCESYKVPVWRCGLQEIMVDPDEWSLPSQVSVFHSRGSIEQCFSNCLSGEPHHIHHKAKELDWIPDVAFPWLDYFFAYCSSNLIQGGIVAIFANGTKSTDRWYSKAVQECAETNGMSLVFDDGNLIHKWIKR